MKLLKPKFWNKKNNLMSLMLLPVSLSLQLLITIKNSFIKKVRFSIPVICVGNIYLGGTGKTPVSIEIVKILKELGKKTAIIKKNYKKHNDEFKLIESKNIKLFKNITRKRAIIEAEMNKFDCVVLDDGFQDPSIAKNLNILCFNEKQLIGNGMTLPSGPLREPLSAIKKCQIIIINGNKNYEFEKVIKENSNNVSIYYAKYQPTNLQRFTSKNLLAFAGIGNPVNFFNLLEENNLTIKKKISFSDHYNYSLKELKRLIDYSIKNNLQLITTEKDFFRMKHFQLPQIECLNVNLELLNKNTFKNEISKYL
jgi:tetraacyldisaccharide 4'-kinase|tara:strand:- start:338 stop:1267 length:930 start_codon:yes stop_codon:yes gene_type:complete